MSAQGVNFFCIHTKTVVWGHSIWTPQALKHKLFKWGSVKSSPGVKIECIHTKTVVWMHSIITPGALLFLRAENPFKCMALGYPSKYPLVPREQQNFPGTYFLHTGRLLFPGHIQTVTSGTDSLTIPPEKLPTSDKFRNLLDSNRFCQMMSILHTKIFSRPTSFARCCSTNSVVAD